VRTTSPRKGLGIFAMALAIAIVIPAGEFSFAAGVMQVIQYFFTQLRIPLAVAPMAVLITIGGVFSLAARVLHGLKGLPVR